MFIIWHEQSSVVNRNNNYDCIQQTSIIIKTILSPLIIKNIWKHKNPFKITRLCVVLFLTYRYTSQLYWIQIKNFSMILSSTIFTNSIRVKSCFYDLLRQWFIHVLLKFSFSTTIRCFEKLKIIILNTEIKMDVYV